MTPLARYPEWKQLYDAILPLIAEGQRSFTYEELSTLAGLDILSNRGRAQFYRCRRELLKIHQIWLENISKSGYALIAAKDHPGAAIRRVGMARRKIGMAKAINKHVRFEDMTSDQRAIQAATAAVLHEIGRSFYAAGRQFQAMAKKEALTVDLPKLLTSIAEIKH